jgi:hypothetical protein
MDVYFTDFIDNGLASGCKLPPSLRNLTILCKWCINRNSRQNYPHSRSVTATLNTYKRCCKMGRIC